MKKLILYAAMAAGNLLNAMDTATEQQVINKEELKKIHKCLDNQLLEAAQKDDNIYEIDELLKQRAKLFCKNEYDETPLELALKNNNGRAAQELLMHLSNQFNACSHVVEDFCKYAVSEQKYQEIEEALELLNNGIVAEVNGWPLRITRLLAQLITYGKKEAAKPLLLCADVNYHLEDGKTIAMVAVLAGDADTLELILKRPNIDLSKKDFKDDCTVFGFARKLGNEKIIALLDAAREKQKEKLAAQMAKLNNL